MRSMAGRGGASCLRVVSWATWTLVGFYDELELTAWCIPILLMPSRWYNVQLSRWPPPRRCYARCAMGCK
jgi:hypothetical protein